MPILLIIFHAIIVIPFMVHALRTHQDRYWIMILLIAPFIGVLLYFLTVILPTLYHTRLGYKLEKKLRSRLSPNAELNAALADYEISATPINQLRLADAYVSNGRSKEALPLYQAALSGIYENDPNIMLKYAKAAFYADNPQQCKDILDQLRHHNPDYNSPEGHLFYAKALAANKEIKAAKTEFEALIKYYVGFEAKVSYAEALFEFNEPLAAKKVLDDLFQVTKRAPSHVKELNAESLKRAKNLLKQLAQ